MSRRSLDNFRQSRAREIRSAAHEETRRAFLVYPYRNGQALTTVQFTDPRFGTVGTMVVARISAGFSGPSGLVPPSLDQGYPVTVVTRRGQVTVVGF